MVTMLAALLLSATAWWFGSGAHPCWWLAWLAPLPVLWLAPRVPARWTALVAFAAYALGGMNQWHYLHGVIGLPLPFDLYAIAAPALVFALCTLLYRRLLRSGRVLAAALAVPAVWVAVEYVNSLGSPHGTWGSIAYGQMDALPVIQLAAVTGLWGISFLLLLVPAALAALSTPTAPRRGRIVAAGTAALLVAASLGYGARRLAAPATGSLRIGLVSLEKPIRPALDSAAGEALETRYVETIGRLANDGAKVVVIPETSFATTAANVAAFAALARQDGLTLDIGIDGKQDPHAERNMVMVFQPDAASPATYFKRHLIPGFEHQYTPGEHYTMLDGSPRTGLAICKDMDFHDIGQAYAERGAQLLLVPAWDFGIDGWLHSRMAIMRGVESGFAIARAARTGRLTLSDDRGRVLAEASSETHDAELVGDLPLRDTHTLYARWGDWFAWLDLVLLAALLCIARPGMRPHSG
jgi:apolipoprotein N-acyltransferase